MCCFSWFTNSLSQAAYFANLGTGHLNGNLIGHLVLMAVNILLGLSLGILFAFNGVLLAWSISLVAGSSITLAMYLHRNRISIFEIFTKYQLIALAIRIVSLSGYLFYDLKNIEQKGCDWYVLINSGMFILAIGVGVVMILFFGLKRERFISTQ